MIELQVYLPNNEREILKKFEKISNPNSIYYGLYEKIQPETRISREKLQAFISQIPEAVAIETYFPDVMLIQLPKSFFGKVKFPKWMHTENDEHFKEVCQTFAKMPSNTSVEVLPHLPMVSQTLRKRLNLECMIDAIQGRTLIAPIDSLFAEFPAVTVYSPIERTLFSEIFPHKVYASYQSQFVPLYLKDAEIKRKLGKLTFAREGRASPDLSLPGSDDFVHLLREVNRKRVENGLQTIGFINPFLYQNAYLFLRKSGETKEFPTTFSLWSGNRGLGRPNLAVMKDALLRLPRKEISPWRRALLFTLRFLRSIILI